MGSHSRHSRHVLALHVPCQSKKAMTAIISDALTEEACCCHASHTPCWSVVRGLLGAVALGKSLHAAVLRTLLEVVVVGECSMHGAHMFTLSAEYASLVKIKGESGQTTQVSQPILST